MATDEERDELVAEAAAQLERDLGFSAPELVGMHIRRRMGELVEAVQDLMEGGD
jgi:hypothetical protein